MTDRPRYVLDTNVIVSGLLFPDSRPGQAFMLARNRGDLLLSDDTVKEITEVLRRPKFDRYLLPEERDKFIASLILSARLVRPSETIRGCRDPEDDKWLELAVGGKATLIVSGDNDLLSLGMIRGIRIVTPVGFVESLTQ
jgi:putative PIN family toxin of toxin-antitoxin system